MNEYTLEGGRGKREREKERIDKHNRYTTKLERKIRKVGQEGKSDRRKDNARARKDNPLYGR